MMGLPMLLMQDLDGLTVLIAPHGRIEAVAADAGLLHPVVHEAPHAVDLT